MIRLIGNPPKQNIGITASPLYRQKTYPIRRNLQYAAW